MGTGVDRSAVAIGIEPESAWLLPTLARLLAAALYLLFWVSIGLAWPMDKVGDAFQFLGLALASLGIPVVTPQLARAERAIRSKMAATQRWFGARREALRRWWARRRGRSVTAHMSGAGTATAGGSAHLTVGRSGVDRATIKEREWLAFLNDEVDALWIAHRRLVEARAVDRVEFTNRLSAQRAELEAHTLAVTREGWQFIVGGAASTAFGILLGLAA